MTTPSHDNITRFAQQARQKMDGDIEPRTFQHKKAMSEFYDVMIFIILNFYAGCSPLLLPLPLSKGEE